MNDSNVAKPAKSGRESWLRWVLGWIVLPASIIAALFLVGVHVGARHPDMLWSRLLLRGFGAEAGVAKPGEARTPTLEPRPGAKPGAAFEYETLLSLEQLEASADESDPLRCDYVCRAYARTQAAEVYSVEHCTLDRPLPAPGLLICSGTLEAGPSKAGTRKAGG